MLWYVIASLTPAVLIAAALWGGVWPVLALLSITVHVAFMDRLGRALRLSDSSGRALTLTLAAAHFLLLPLGVWAIGAAPHLEGLDRALIFAALGLFLGQISNSNAHELIHASRRLPRRIGTAIYISLLHGHHVSAHLRVHHPAAATPADPNSAPKGMGFWRFLLSASWGVSRRVAGRQRAAGARRGAGLPPAPRGAALALHILGGVAGSPISNWRPMRRCNCCCRTMCSTMGYGESSAPMAGLSRWARSTVGTRRNGTLPR